MERKKISARIIADSLNEHGNRLTTFVLTFPRIVLAEFNTHRMISKNSASSRAIPFDKMVSMVEEDPFIPIKWMKDHKGMQGKEFFEDEADIAMRIFEWKTARDFAVLRAKIMSENGVTKQLCNRLLEPFMWHTVIATSTEWENFFALRAHDDAEIHIQELAYRMLDEYNAHTPKQLKAGEWHIPFGDKIDESRIFKTEEWEGGKLNWKPHPSFEDWATEWYQMQKVKIATARCARVSYLNFEGKDDYEADIKLHDRLLESGHMSPFEHCAKAMTDVQYDELHTHFYGEPRAQRGWCGNFRGFIQYRKMLAGENKIDNRVNK